MPVANPGSATSFDAVELQRAYYEETAGSYDVSHVEREHVVALHVLSGFIAMNGIRSVLDVGAGTGRAMKFLKARFPDLVVKGIEPVEALRRQGHSQGIPETDLVGGDGAALPFPDASFDLVSEFAVLHHVRRPESVIAEMNRVAAKMIAISDCNFMGQGPGWLRLIKLGLWGTGLWPLADWVKTRGKGYTYSEGDGIAYSYSVFQNLRQIQRCWDDVQIIATSQNDASYSGPLINAAHVLLVAHKQRGGLSDRTEMAAPGAYP